MNSGDALIKARRFADSAYFAEVETLSKQYDKKLGEMRSQMAARGLIMSGATTVETARINGERFKAMLQARLNFLLEGYELHGVEIDDPLATSTVNEIMNLRNNLVAQAKQRVGEGAHDITIGGTDAYIQSLEQNIGVSGNSIRTQIDRRRMMPKKTEVPSSVTNVYHVYGNNARWNTNSSDYSTNVVALSGEQVFANLRQEIASHIPVGHEREGILQQLAALEAAKDSPSFAQRYAGFISAAANHMVLIGPFIPALTEMLQKILTK
jgi:hypothetical protein